MASTSRRHRWRSRSPISICPRLRRPLPRQGDPAAGYRATSRHLGTLAGLYWDSRTGSTHRFLFENGGLLIDGGGRREVPARTGGSRRLPHHRGAEAIHLAVQEGSRRPGGRRGRRRVAGASPCPGPRCVGSASVAPVPHRRLVQHGARHDLECRAGGGAAGRHSAPDGGGFTHPAVRRRIPVAARFCTGVHPGRERQAGEYDRVDQRVRRLRFSRAGPAS